MTAKFKLLVVFLITFFIVLVETVLSFSSVFLPSIKNDFLISEQMAQMTIAVLLFALGFSAIIYGGLANSFGRRPMFVFSVSILCISTLVCALAKSFTVFMVARFLLGLGSGAGWAVGNACMKDLYDGKSYVKIMNAVHSITGIAPAVMPIIGSYCAVTIGWRNSFIVLFVIGLLLSIVIFFFHPETIVQKSSKNIKNIAGDYYNVFRNRQFLRYCTIKVLCVALIFCELTTIPLVFINYLGVETQNYGYYILAAFLFYIFAVTASGYFSKKYHVDSMLKIGLCLIILSNAFLLTFDYCITMSAIFIQSVKCLTYAGWGFIFGNATAQIVSSVPGKASIASAIMIASEMLFSALMVYLLGFVFDGTVKPLSFCMVSLATISFLCLKPPKRKIKGGSKETPNIPEIM